MYVVRRAFRNLGQMMAPGSVVEPAAIKRFKSRVAEGRIVEVNEHNFDKWHEYFKVRMNVTIQLPDEQKPDEQKPDEQKPDEQKPDEQKPDEQKPDEQKPDEQKPDEQKPDEQKPTVTPVVKIVAK